MILLILSATVYGQNQDVCLWTSLSIRYDPGKKWKLSLEEEARFFENMSRPDKLNSELTIDYKINKLLNAGVLYRLITNLNPRKSFDFNHRISAYLGVQKKYAGFSCSLQTTFQKTYSEFQHSDGWYIPENYVRILSEVSRELKNKKTELYANIEFWHRIQTGDQDFIDQYRFTAGIKHKLNKRHRLDLFYKIQQELQVKNPLTSHIFGVGYRYNIR